MVQLVSYMLLDYLLSVAHMFDSAVQQEFSQRKVSMNSGIGLIPQHGIPLVVLLEAPYTQV